MEITGVLRVLYVGGVFHYGTLSIMVLLFRATPLWEKHHIFTKNLKVIGGWILSLINAQVSIFPTNVGLLSTLLTLDTFSTI